jgi:hypothetical protein
MRLSLGLRIRTVTAEHATHITLQFLYETVVVLAAEYATNDLHIASHFFEQTGRHMRPTLPPLMRLVGGEETHQNFSGRLNLVRE